MVLISQSIISTVKIFILNHPSKNSIIVIVILIINRPFVPLLNDMASHIGFHTFAQLNSIIHQRQQLCLVRARKHQRRNSHGLYNLQQVLNLGSCLDKTLNSVEVLEKYLISLLGHQNSFKFTTLSKTIVIHEQYLTSVSYFKGCLCTSNTIVSQTQSFSISILVESSILGNTINHGRRSKIIHHSVTWFSQ